MLRAGCGRGSSNTVEGGCGIESWSRAYWVTHPLIVSFVLGDMVVEEEEGGEVGGGRYMESINIHPTNGGVAPLYSPRTPSFCIVFLRQSIGPAN